MRFGSLCSGIEAASVAQPGGWEAAWFAEIEPFPCAVLAQHYPLVPNHGDMMQLREQIMLGRVVAPDVLVGGPPCQAFSVAGLRQGLGDARGNLTLEYVEILNAIDDIRAERGERPCTAVYENVPGILSDKTNAFGCLLGALVGADAALETETGKWPRSGLVCGPRRRVAWAILDAQWFGVAQRRRRVWLVAQDCDVIADLGERACPGQILSIGKSLRRDTPTRSKAREAAAGDAGAGVACSSGADLARCLHTHEGTNLDAETSTIVAFHAEAQADQLPTDARDTSVSDSLTTSQHAAVAFHSTESHSSGNCHEISPTLRVGSNGAGQPLAVAYQQEPLYEYACDCCPCHFLWRGLADPRGRVQCPECGNTEHFDCMGEVEEQVVVAFQSKESHSSGKNDNISPTLRVGSNGMPPAVAIGVDCYNGAVTGDVAHTVRSGRSDHDHQPTVAIGIDQELNAHDNLAGTLQRKGQGGFEGSVATAACYDYMGTHGGGVCEGVSPTLKKKDGVATHIGMQVRRLTPEECEALQGFPRGYTRIPWRKKSPEDCPDGPRYKALGNSWAVPCARWVLERVANTVEEQRA